MQINSRDAGVPTLNFFEKKTKNASVFVALLLAETPLFLLCRNDDVLVYLKKQKRSCRSVSVLLKSVPFFGTAE